MLKSDKTPTGVELRDHEDYSAIRNNVFNSTLEAMKKKFPITYGGVRLELDDISYDGNKDFSLEQQKDALMKDKYLAWRLRGSLSLYEEATNKKLDTKKVTLMRVPYITDRGTTIHNGNEYVTLTQGRLLPGVYTRRKSSGEIESHFNARRGSGTSFKIRFEPESKIYRLDIGQANLKLYSLLSDLGVSDEKMLKSWGPEILAANKAGYDSRVFDKAYSRLVRFPDTNASKDQKAAAIWEALKSTKFDNSVLQNTLPNRFTSKVAAEWKAKEAMMTAPAFGPNPQLQNSQVTDNADAYVKWEQKKQEQQMKEQEAQRKHEFELDALRGKLPPEGPDRRVIEKQLMQHQINLRKTMNNIETKRLVSEIKAQQQRELSELKLKSQEELEEFNRRSKEELDDINHNINLLKARSDKDQKDGDLDKSRRMKQELADLKDKVKQELDDKKQKIKDEEQSLKNKQDKEKKASEGIKDPQIVLDILKDAKKFSDAGNYAKKTELMRSIIREHYKDFFIDEEKGNIVGITHAPTGFRMHLPREAIIEFDIEKRDPKKPFAKSASKKTKSIKVLQSGQSIDVDRLYSLVSDNKEVSIEDVPLSEVKGVGPRSRRFGFGPKRYERADENKPGLIDPSGYLIDGRHRFYKRKDMGLPSGRFIRVSHADIAKAYSEQDYSVEQKISI